MEQKNDEEPICDKETSLKLFHKFCLEFQKNYKNYYYYPHINMCKEAESTYVNEKIVLEVISPVPFYGYNDSIHFVAITENHIAYHVYVFDYMRTFKYTNFTKGKQFICPGRNMVFETDPKILTILCFGFEIEMLSDNFYNLTAEEYKTKGNNAFDNEKYELACNYYSKAIELDSSSEVYYLNRSNAYIKQKDYMRSYSDSSKALMINSKNMKAVYRQALSLFELEEYEQSLKILQENLNLIEDEKYILIAFQRLIMKNEKFINNTKGIFTSCFYLKSQGEEEYQFANFISEKIEIRFSNLEGKGIFAKEDIQPGELILIKKAVYSEDLPSTKSSEKLFSVFEKNVLAQIRMSHSISKSSTDFSIFKPGVFFREKLFEKKIDYDEVRRHALQVANSRSFQTRSKFCINLISSLFNNSCKPVNNVEHFEIEDKSSEIHVLQSKMFIKKGEELLINYEQGITTYEERNIQFRNWRFTCKCRYCSIDKNSDFGGKIKKHQKKCLDLINERKKKESQNAIDDLITYHSSIEKEYSNSEVFIKFHEIILNYQANFPNCLEIVKKGRVFMLDYLEYQDRGFYYEKVVRFYGLWLGLIDKEIGEKYQSNCCSLVKDIINRYYSTCKR